MPSVFVVWKFVGTQHGPRRRIESPRYRTRALAERNLGTYVKDDEEGGVTEVDLANARVDGGFLHGHPVDDAVAARAIKSHPHSDFASAQKARLRTAWFDVLAFLAKKQHWDYFFVDARKDTAYWAACQIALAFDAADGVMPFERNSEEERQECIEHVIEWTTRKADKWFSILEKDTSQDKTIWMARKLERGYSNLSDLLAMENGKVVPVEPTGRGKVIGTFRGTEWLITI